MMSDAYHEELEMLRAANARRERDHVKALIEEAGEWLDEDALRERAPGCDLDALCGVEFDGGRRYPAFQLTQVLAALPSFDGLSRLQFLLSGHPGLRGRSPLDALQALERGEVIEGVDVFKLAGLARIEWDHGGW
jgi:hypothetical protein